jgi:processive 1,2-diacylglycerol beta-glucosyltransferase
MDVLKKILIVYTNAGAGHRRAAEALYQVAAAQFPTATIRILDTLDYATPFLRKHYPGSYLFMVHYCPWLWGLFYYLVDSRFIYPLVRWFRRTTNSLHCQKFENYIQEEKPDLVISTHFLPNEIISHIKRKHGFTTCLATCITDYYPHMFWRDTGVDWYFTPNRDLAERLGKWGVPAERIKDFGIPIMPEFGLEQPVAALRLRLGLTEKFTVLITSGGYGVGPAEELIEQLKRIRRSFQAIVICGNNPKLVADLAHFKDDPGHRFQIYGFVDNMHELMSISDVMISKAGGLTTTEAMAKGLPLIVLYPIPGQESSNCDFLLQYRASLRARSPRHARRLVEELLTKPEKVRILKDNIRKLSRPRAATQICTLLAEFATKELTESRKA